MVALVATGLSCGQAECFGIYRGSRRPSGYCSGLQGRLKTSKLDCGGFWGMLVPHIMLLGMARGVD